MLNSLQSSVIYISQIEGNDNNGGFSPVPDGKGDGPIQSIDRLHMLLTAIRAGDLHRPITVRIMGDYCLDKPLALGADNASGQYGNRIPMNDITVESYGDTRARLIGGKILKGFVPDRFNGADCLSLYIPEVKEGKWLFSDLYVNGAPARSSRYPKQGTLRGVTTENPDPLAPLTNGSSWFIANKEDLANISGVENAIVSFCHYWIDEHSPVKSYDRETGKLTMQYRSRFRLTVDYENNPASDLHYYLENVAQTFSEPGEWYLDVKNGMLYYIPEEGQTADDLEVIAPTQKHWATVRGTTDNKAVGIRFRNLDFLATKGEYESRSSLAAGGEPGTIYAADAQSCYAAHGAIRFENAEDCAVDNCRILCAGVHGIEINKGCDNVRVENCTIMNSGAGGIKVWGTAAEGDDDVRPTVHCVIRGNHIERCGLRYAAGCGVLICHSSHNEISDNEICHLGYTGISVGWSWGYPPSSTYGNLIKNNHVHHIGQGQLSDMGGIYLLGAQHGTVVSGNRVHDIVSSNYGGIGIYTDEGSSYLLIENNVVFRCKDCCYQHHYGKHNVLRGNVFAFAGLALTMVTRSEQHLSVLAEENTFITDGTPLYKIGASISVFSPDLTTCNNRVWDIGLEQPIAFRWDDKEIAFDEWQTHYGYDVGSRVERPSDEIRELIGAKDGK